MSNFPRKETDIIALAQDIAAGIQANPTLFPNPPVVAADLSAQITEYQQFSAQIVAAVSALTGLHGLKDDNLAAMIQMMKDLIAYVEMLAHGDPAILSKINWSGRSAPVALQPPGQCLALEIADQGAGWVKVSWKEPADGGKVAAYEIERSEDGTNFVEAGTSIATETILVNQPTMKTLIYRVVAINRAGEGMESNTISLIL